MRSKFTHIGRTLATVAVAVGLTGGCAVSKPLKPLASDTPNSVVLASGERVCDMTGKWDAEYTTSNDVVEFTQTKDGTFSGIKTIGGRYVFKGGETIRGKLKMNNFEKLEAAHSFLGWVSVIGEFFNGCDTLIITGEGEYINLNRK